MEALDPRIKLVRSCVWEEVFLSWYESEGKNLQWAQLAKERGYASWADWRIKGYARRFECEKAQWGLYEIDQPSEVVTGWFGGPFHTWIERHYDGDKTRSFRELAERQDIYESKWMAEMVAAYPKDSVIAALRLADGRIFVIEGMHRACTLARLGGIGEPYPEKLIFAIGESDLVSLPIVGKNTVKA